MRTCTLSILLLALAGCRTTADVLVEMGTTLGAPPDGRLQTADVYVRTKGYTYPAQIVESERVEQVWYRSLNGWFVDWELPEEGE